MSEQPVADTSPVPRFDIADRMRKALRTSNVSVEDMADYLEISRRSVGNWINGRAAPATKYLQLWALKTGVPYTWLCHGDLNPCDLRPMAEVRRISAGQRRNGRPANNMHYSQTMISA